jgi:D-alanine transaminase/branched-chain amino acid aminotransferase
VYESFRVEDRVPYFLAQHIERLQESARIIGLLHPFSAAIVADAVTALVQKEESGVYNLKILLIGGDEPQLNIIPLNPFFPDKQWYRDGVSCVTHEYERAFPHAKSLNMLGSYLAYKKAREAKAYDTLLVDRKGDITEGTRTNFYCMKDKTIVSPPSEKILLGVTRLVLLRVAAANGFELIEKDISPQDMPQYDAAFLTSTSSGIMPIATVDDHQFGPPTPALKGLMTAFDAFVAASKGTLN